MASRAIPVGDHVPDQRVAAAQLRDYGRWPSRRHGWLLNRPLEALDRLRVQRGVLVTPRVRARVLGAASLVGRRVALPGWRVDGHVPCRARCSVVTCYDDAQRLVNDLPDPRTLTDREKIAYAQVVAPPARPKPSMLCWVVLCRIGVGIKA
jgi:hypothetical protein